MDPAGSLPPRWRIRPCGGRGGWGSCSCCVVRFIWCHHQLTRVQICLQRSLCPSWQRGRAPLYRCVQLQVNREGRELFLNLLRLSCAQLTATLRPRGVFWAAHSVARHPAALPERRHAPRCTRCGLCEAQVTRQARALRPAQHPAAGLPLSSPSVASARVLPLVIST